MHLHFRPYAKEILTALKPFCELIVWTAGQQDCANKVINALDTEQNLFDQRLYRDKCFVSPQGVYIKDLRILGRDLSKCFLIDNAAYSFGFQIANGILVLPFKGEKNDTELLMLSEYIQFLMKQPNPTQYNLKHFRYDEYSRSTSLDSLKAKFTKN